SVQNTSNAVKDAQASPLCYRLLMADNQHSSNVIVLTPGKDPERLIERVESIAHEFDRKDFRIRIAGAPYVVEMIRRSIGHDFVYFCITTIVLFGASVGWVVCWV